MHGTFSWSKCYLFYCAPLLFHSLTPMSPLRSIVLTMYLGYRLPDGSIDSFLTISPSSMQWQQTLVRLGGGAVGLSWAQDLPRHWWVRCFFRVSCLYGFYQRSDFIYNYIFFFLFFFFCVIYVRYNYLVFLLPTWLNLSLVIIIIIVSNFICNWWPGTCIFHRICNTLWMTHDAIQCCNLREEVVV